MLSHELTSAEDKPLILIVDDERLNQQILASLLNDKYRIKVASNGGRAIEIAKQNPQLALILLDVAMPEMDGYEVCKRLKEDSLTKNIPIIFITAAHDEASESLGLRMGAVDYITKPIKPIITKIRVQKNIALKYYQEKLQLSAKIIENSKEAVFVTDIACNIIDVNNAFTKVTGYSLGDVLGQNPSILNSGHQDSEFYAAIWHEVAMNGQWSGELYNRRKDGELYPEGINIIAILDDSGRITHYVGIATDITLQKQRESRLEHIAHYDALTGIPNRVLLADRMKQALIQTQRDKKLLGVCYLDLDGFKPVNDTLGHQAGDLVLIEIAHRIGQTIRAGDTVARLGGDEFAILLTDLSYEEECAVTIARILVAISRPILINKRSFMLSASIGVTLFPLDSSEPDTLLRHADHAMYAAKQSGKNCYHLYNTTHDSKVRLHNEALKRIRIGLRQHEFKLFYQPKVDMRTGNLVGVEALIRWQHPERGLLFPIDFLPLIELDDLIVELGDWVINTVLAQLRKWLAAGCNIKISFNVAGRQLQHEDFIAKLDAALALYPEIPSNLLELEILETSALEIVQSAQIILDACTQLGVSFALDDFGTGYSSLIYLKTLPVRTLKIDQTFVRDMLENDGDRAIVQSIIALAHSFKRKTVAEGIETQEHFEALLSMGCDIGQGYGIARPMPSDEFMAWQAGKRQR